MRNSAFLAIAAVGALVGSSALAQGPVYSVNIVGFQKAPVSNGRIDFVATPFVAGTSSLDDVLGTQATDTDEVFIFNSATQAYKKYVFIPSGTEGAEPFWNHWVDADTFEIPTGLSVGPGSGFIFRNSSVATNNLTFVGDVVSATTKTVTIPSGLSILSYPFSTSIALNASTLSGQTGSAREGDNIFFFNPATQAYKKYEFVGDAGDPLLNYKWLDSDTFAPAETTGPNAILLNPGDSFFYRNPGTAITWTETKPY